MDDYKLNHGQDICDGRFIVLKKLGNGAFGEIYEVEGKKDG